MLKMREELDIINTGYGIYEGEVLFDSVENVARLNMMYTMSESRTIMDGDIEHRYEKMFQGNNWTHMVLLELNNRDEPKYKRFKEQKFIFLSNTRGEVFFIKEGQSKLKQIYGFPALSKSVHEENGNIVITNRIDERTVLQYDPILRSLSIKA